MWPWRFLAVMSLRPRREGQQGQVVTHFPDVIRPILETPDSVNQRLPSGPAVIHEGWLLGVDTGNSVRVPVGVMRPIWLSLLSMNQRLPSGPAVISAGLLLGVGIAKSSM